MLHLVLNHSIRNEVFAQATLLISVFCIIIIIIIIIINIDVALGQTLLLTY